MWTGFCLRRQSFTTTECSTRLCIFGQCPTSTRQHWPMRADTSLNRCSVEFRGSKWKYMCLSGFGYIFDFIVILIIIFFITIFILRYFLRAPGRTCWCWCLCASARSNVYGLFRFCEKRPSIPMKREIWRGREEIDAARSSNKRNSDP